MIIELKYTLCVCIYTYIHIYIGFLVAQMVKNLPAMQETQVQSPGERSGNSLQYSCLGNPMDRGAWWATVHGVTKNWTLLSD